MLRSVLGVLALILGPALGLAAAAPAATGVDRFVAGQDYKVIDQPMAPRGQPKIHVAEFFLYSCPHCYRFQSTIEDWRKTLAEDVAFDHSPVLFGRGAKAYARLYYAEAELGVLDRLHDAVFNAIHQQGNFLQTAAARRDFMAAHGVDSARFARVYQSDAVSDAVAAARRRMQRFGVRAVPSMGVAGRYWVSGRVAGSNERMLEVVDYLIEKARNARASNRANG